MVRKFKIGVIGSGSWATALVYILTVKRYNINWLVRKQENINYIKEFKRNPNYLRDLELKVKRINFSINRDNGANHREITEEW